MHATLENTLKSLFGLLLLRRAYILQKHIARTPRIELQILFSSAAEIDGAGFFRIIFSIYMPMLAPVIALMVVQTFIGQWNDYLFPMIFRVRDTAE